MKALILRLDAPMMSFGGVIIDQHGYIHRFPGASMLAGLVANSLGWSHADFKRIQALQNRIKYAARWDVRPYHMVDYQTVDLGQPKMKNLGWTTLGVAEHRAGGTSAKFGTHQRYRHYWVDGLMTVAMSLEGDATPTFDEVKEALRHPARPLFIGRKCCLPARPILDPRPEIEAVDLLDALRKVPPWDRHGNPSLLGEFEACWPPGVKAAPAADSREVYELRDWTNQLPAGSRRRMEGILRGHKS